MSWGHVPHFCRFSRNVDLVYRYGEKIPGASRNNWNHADRCIFNDFDLLLLSGNPSCAVLLLVLNFLKLSLYLNIPVRWYIAGPRETPSDRLLLASTPLCITMRVLPLSLLPLDHLLASGFPSTTSSSLQQPLCVVEMVLSTCDYVRSRVHPPRTLNTRDW